MFMATETKRNHNGLFRCELMHTKKLGEKLFQVDLGTGGLKNLIASYVLVGEKAVIVDCGPTSSIPNLVEGLEELNVDPQDVAYVAVTHVHADHAGGAGTLLKVLPNAKVVAQSRGVPHLVNPARLWAATKETLDYVAEIFGEPEPVSEDRVIVASEGMIFDVGKDVALRVVETPGHASHNLSYFDSVNVGLFPGDAAGAYLGEFDTVLPTTPPPFRPDIALISLDKLIGLNPTALFYPHFGEAKNGATHLRNYVAQIKGWLEIAQDGVKRGESDDVIRERFFKEDQTIPEEIRAKIVPALKANSVQRKTLWLNSTLGFIDFARNPQI